jgi:hypothetical protein
MRNGDRAASVRSMPEDDYPLCVSNYLDGGSQCIQLDCEGASLELKAQEAVTTNQ